MGPDPRAQLGHPQRPGRHLTGPDRRGALQEYHAILQRMCELCVQASNDGLMNQDRAAL